MKFVDTSFSVALPVPRNRQHPAARAPWESDLGALVCTNHVLGETWTCLRRRAGHGAAVAFLDAAARSPRLVRPHVGKESEAEALTWLRRRDEREFSFADAVSFAFMRRHRLTQALAFDGAFSAAGFVELRPRND